MSKSKYKQNSSPVFTVDGLLKEGVPEIKLRFYKSTRKKFLGKVTSSADAANFIRSIYKRGEIQLQEQFITLYLNRANHIVGYYKHSIGSISATIADVRLILSAALNSASSAIIMAHNHPSGNLKPSNADEVLTKKIVEAAKVMDINVLDHFIITQDSYYSFADEGLLGLDGLNGADKATALKNPSGHSLFVRQIEQDLKAKKKHSKISVEKLAASFGIGDKTEVKELTELAIVNVARAIAHTQESIKNKFQQIVDLYNHQVTLSHRTSQSILLQQYSTPAPITYLAGLFTGADKGVSLFEPSAGNGLMTIAANPQNVIVNEVDSFRRSNLEKQGFKKVLAQDATEPFTSFHKKFEAVITNPPFGILDKAIKYDTFAITTLDHLMALRALDTMQDSGKAAIIIGGHTAWDSKGRIQAGKNRIFFNYLYSRYHVADVLNLDGKRLYSRQGTGFNVRLILISGRKKTPAGAAPAKDPYQAQVVRTFEDLYERVSQHMNTSNLSLKAKALKLKLQLLHDSELGAPYQPASESCIVLDTQVPDSMEFETHTANRMIKEAVGGDMDEFVRERLDYASKTELCKALSAEQIDAAGMAIYNIEARGQGMIIGDQTGIGKGRVAASIIRYAVVHGHKPVFLTEKANLFSDIYRDLVAIGAGDFVPFIVNGRESKTDIKDEQGNVVHQAWPASEQKAVFQRKKVPANCDFVVATYSQFNSPETKPEKPAFLNAIAEGTIFILDESHNSSGSSNTGNFLQSVISKAEGVVFLSATFAKRPDNMPVYAMKTAISEANMSREDLVEAIQKGGVALQEVLASQLVAEGQMLRRERSFEGVEVNYITLTEKEQEHRAIADNVTDILRDIIAFQTNYIDKEVEELDDIAAAEGKEVELREGTSQAGVDNQPYFSKVFNVINQMLFSIKAETVADRAIERLKEGKKPVIAFASTMGSFIEQMETDSGMPVQDGDIIDADFTEVLQKGLIGVLRYTESGIDGKKEYKRFELSELSPEAQADYFRIAEKIKTVSTGITISPIDVIVQKLTKAGYRVAEVTGRKYELQLNTKTNMGLLKMRKKINTNDAFRQFNNNEMDVLLINQSGSTGASAHAIVTDKVPAHQVKQRVMIVLQAELDINTEVQKRGRINRTGQIKKPIYDYVNSAIPAEQRLMMMLQKKLKSLDANTTSNQKQSTKILDVPDFLNKYGDKIVTEYLAENPEINELLNDPLHIKDTSSETANVVEDAAHKVSGRVAVLSTKMQQDFYQEIATRYQEYVEYLQQIGEYDLEVEAMNLEAETISRKIIKVGKGGESKFGEDSILETVKANVLRKPFNRNELNNMITEALAGKEALVLQSELIESFEAFAESRLKEELAKLEEKYTALIEEVPNEKKMVKVLKQEGDAAYIAAIEERKKELAGAWEKAIAQTQRQYENRKDYLLRTFRFFHTGQKLNYPITNFQDGEQLVLAVCLGFIVDLKKKNPYAPSAIRLRLAIADSNKYLAIPLSYSKDVAAIKGASSRVYDRGKEATLSEWETAITNSQADRYIRHIITGNLLQAFSDFKGKLVSYTTLGGGVKKGILMPEYWEPDEDFNNKIIVPVSKALPLIRSLTTGAAIYTNNNLAIFRQPAQYRIIVPASRKQGGNLYLDEDILKLVDGGRFEKTSDKMVTTLPLEKVDALVYILQEKFSASVTITSFQFDTIKEELPEKKTAGKKLSPVRPKVKRMIRKPNLKLKARALKLKLELLKFAA
jgi:predicted RNA methylase